MLRVLFSLIALAFVPALAADDQAAARKPKRFAIIFNMGYAGDRLPKDPAAFERMVVGVKAAHFNTILCRYEPWRAAICKKHGMQIFVDLLAGDHHVYKNVEGAKKLCTSLRGNGVVYGYHLWSDNIGNTYPGRSRDVKNVHSWDPTHAAYVGTYRMSRVNRVVGMDLLGYYDFHWSRGGHWGNVAKASGVTKAKGASFLRYCDPSPGLIGKGNPNRCGYTIATSIPFGLKGYLFHYRGGVIDLKTGKLDALGKDMQMVNAKFAAIGDELMAIGNPVAVWSAKVTKTAKDRPTGVAAAVPGGLPVIPAENWVQVKAGEVLLGHFKDGKGRDVLALASHNAYQPQAVRLEFKGVPKGVELFDRKKRQWVKSRVAGNAVEFSVEEYATELVRVMR
tara:strand:+ start:218 stop:1396 length:1179 start_codon:yes stop_codon:yes gene_type:complete